MKALLRLLLGEKPKEKKVNDLVPRGVIKTIVTGEYKKEGTIHWDRHKFDESKIVEL